MTMRIKTDRNFARVACAGFMASRWEEDDREDREDREAMREARLEARIADDMIDGEFID
jgi:hypothetical protein